MKRYTAIRVSRETRDLLLKLKGKKSWDSFLREIALAEIQKRRKIVREKLEELLELDYGEVVVKNWAKEF
uniref:VapB-type antitoxin n=1 Tax=Thermofilum adornatum TaxID=1365176 RepID=A0A7C1CCZ0_9CREN